MKILIVDDEYSKVQEISEAVKQANLESVEIVHASTANAARKSLHAADYDMLVIDLYLPNTIGDKPSQRGGFDLLDLINLDDKINLPADILFITGKDESIEETRNEALERGAVLCQYRLDSKEWSKVLIGRIKYALLRLSRNSKVDIAIITALGSPELDAVLNLPYDWKATRINNDPVSYHFGKIELKDRTLSVVAASPLRKGMPSSAAVASKLAFMFQPKYLVMLGICAGIPGKTNLGDVVVADPTWDWGSGKHGTDADGSPVFQAAPYQMPLSTDINQIVSGLANDRLVSQEINAGWGGNVPPGKLKIHLGPMASGASVIADLDTTNSIAIQQREVLAIEMEAYGVMSAVEYAKNPKPTAIIIKSVCDFADKNKNDDWQKYSSYTSAAFANQLFRHLNFSS